MHCFRRRDRAGGRLTAARLHFVFLPGRTDAYTDVTAARRAIGAVLTPRDLARDGERSRYGAREAESLTLDRPAAAATFARLLANSDTPATLALERRVEERLARYGLGPMTKTPSDTKSRKAVYNLTLA